MSLQDSPSMISGQILFSSWGYDQTNVDFYQVIEVKNGFAIVQKMESIPQDQGGMTGRMMPGVLIPGAPKIRRKIKNYGKDVIRIESYASAAAWDGKPKYYSSYA